MPALNRNRRKRINRVVPRITRDRQDNLQPIKDYPARHKSFRQSRMLILLRLLELFAAIAAIATISAWWIVERPAILEQRQLFENQVVMFELQMDKNARTQVIDDNAPFSQRKAAVSYLKKDNILENLDFSEAAQENRAGDVARLFMSCPSETLILRNIDFSNANLDYACFRGTRFENVNFSGARIRSADMTNTVFYNSPLENADTLHSNFTGSMQDPAQTSKQIKRPINIDNKNDPIFVYENTQHLYRDESVLPRNCWAWIDLDRLRKLNSRDASYFGDDFVQKCHLFPKSLKPYWDNLANSRLAFPPNKFEMEGRHFSERDPLRAPLIHTLKTFETLESFLNIVGSEEEKTYLSKLKQYMCEFPIESRLDPEFKVEEICKSKPTP